uniref:Zinc finger HIT domain-containing protein 1 n=1 Tax=Neogobius melanostomus TaxID=47308 RepID=A0A8C6T1J9_9GOBI
MVLEKKGSARVEAGQRRVLDDATRQRRLTRQLEALERDNFQDDPLSSLPPPGPTARLRPSARARSQKRNVVKLVEIISNSASGRTSLLCWRRRTCRRGRSLTTCLRRPRPRPSPSLVLLCLWIPLTLHLHHLRGRYCSTRCLVTHRETRCLKWTL